MKLSISLIEIIFSLVILTVILLTSSNIILLLNKQNQTSKEHLLLKLDFETTRLYLQYIIKDDKNLNSIKFNNNILYHNNDILLNNVTKFTKQININTIFITLCIKYSNEICQDIRIKNAI